LDVDLTENEPTPYDSLRSFRVTERAQMIGAIRELIEEAHKRVKSKNTPSGERTKYMRLAGQLIWYKDQILRSLSYEALEKEVAEMKKRVFQAHPDPPRPPPVYGRRTIRGAGEAYAWLGPKRPNTATSKRNRH
jgi:hypothetical protein